MKLVVCCKDEVHVIEQKEILYCSSENSYTVVILICGKKLIISKPLKRVLEQLDSRCFVKVSQSCLVNLEHVSRIDKRNKLVELFGKRKIRFTIKVGTLVEFLCGLNDVKYA